MGQKELAGVIDELRDKLASANAEIADLKLKLEKSGQLVELLWELRKS
jgi:hypothetical protein